MTQPLVQKFPREMLNAKWLKNSMNLKTSSFSVVPGLQGTNRQWIYGGLSKHLWKDDKSKQQPQLQCFFILACSAQIVVVHWGYIQLTVG